MDELKLELHSPITEEEWDLITDVDLDHTPSVIFHTKHGKDVEYIKVKHGRWVKMSDADGMYYVCSECGNELTREIDFNPQFDLFPKLKCIDKTTYCPSCGAKMDL